MTWLVRSTSNKVTKEEDWKESLKNEIVNTLKQKKKKKKAFKLQHSTVKYRF